MPYSPQVDTLTKVRFIINYWFQPCETPFNVWVDHSQEPGKDLFLLFFSFNLKDFFQEYFRPRGPRQRRHGRKGRKTGRPALGIPDISESTAQRVKPDFDIIPANKIRGTRSFFTVLGGIDRFNWNCAVVEGFTDFGFETLWGVIHDDRSQCPSLGRFSRTDDTVTLNIPHNEWLPVGVANLRYILGCTSSTGFAVSLTEGKWIVTWVGTLRASEGLDATGVRVRLRTETGEVLDETILGDVSGDDEIEFMLDATVNAFTIVRWEALSVTGFYVIHDIQVTALKIKI